MSVVNKIIVGTRGSRLSLAQAEHFKDELLLANKNLKPTDVEIQRCMIYYSLNNAINY